MSKYIWKCENCGEEFAAENPTQCLKCGHDDITILREVGPDPEWVKKIMIASVGIIAIVLVIYHWDNIFVRNTTTTTTTQDGTTYHSKIEKHDNYFEINGVDIDNDKLGLYVINSSSGNKLYSEGNEFYPCEDGDFLIKWEVQKDVKIEGPKKIKNFKLSVEPHENACEEQLAIVDIDVRSSDCKYTIMTNMDDDPNLEVSLRENNGYQKGKLVWELSEINGATHFYVRLKESDQIERIRIPFCEVPIEVEAPKPPVVVAAFELYMTDVTDKAKRKQFTDLIDTDKYSADIVYKGNQMDIMSFILIIRTEVRNNGDAFLGSFKLTQNNVIYNSDNTEIKKLKLTQL